MDGYTLRRSCRICGSTDLHPFLDLGSTPLADAFPRTKTEVERFYPLQAKVCGACFLVQQCVDVDDALLYGPDYGFYTGASPSSLAYFREYAQDLLERYPIQARRLTLEIASNDGTFLQHFQAGGARVLGIDPAAMAVDVAQQGGIPTMLAPFNAANARKIVHQVGQAGLVVANNVVAHVIDLHDFMVGIDHVLAPDGIFVCEVQYFPALLQGKCFDNVYHEHRSFFSLTSLLLLLEQEGFEVVDLAYPNRQGGSLRVTARRRTSMVLAKVVTDGLAAEMADGIDRLEHYRGFQEKVDGMRDELVATLETLKRNHELLAGYGASAKSTTLLNYCGIDDRLLNYVLDATPYKLGRYTPGSKLKIVGPQQEGPPRADVYLLLIWNYLDDVLAREKGYLARGGRFVVPLPTPRIYPKPWKGG